MTLVSSTPDAQIEKKKSSSLIRRVLRLFGDRLFGGTIAYSAKPIAYSASDIAYSAAKDRLFGEGSLIRRRYRLFGGHRLFGESLNTSATKSLGLHSLFGEALKALRY